MIKVLQAWKISKPASTLTKPESSRHIRSPRWYGAWNRSRSRILSIYVEKANGNAFVEAQASDLNERRVSVALRLCPISQALESHLLPPLS